MPRALIPLCIAACAWFRFSAAQQDKGLEGTGTSIWEQVCQDSSSGSCTTEEAASLLLLQEKLHTASLPKTSSDSKSMAVGELIDGAVPLKLLPRPSSKDTGSLELHVDASPVSSSRVPARVHSLRRIVDMMAGALVTGASPARVDPLSDFPVTEHTQSENQKPLPKSVVEATLWFSYLCCALYSMCIIRDLRKLLICKGISISSLLHKPDDRVPSRPSPAAAYSTTGSPRKQRWSVLGIWGLCFYRVYSGFLSATWLPYVLAMEGGTLWPQNQSLFMGCCKLIYGVTVLANPLCGLLSDKLAEISRGAARRLWILLGIVMSAAGILICLYAGPADYFWCYIFGITLWRIGEALNDVTLEAILPEMVPQEQFEVASAVKAASFLVGGLVGYTLVYTYAHLHYSWCYYAYLVCMFLTAIPSLLLLSDDSPLDPTDRSHASILKQMAACYSTPMSYDGGFPECSLAIFTMACGTAPFYFTLLIIRDLIGVHTIITLQHYFAITCLAFFLSAAIFASYDVVFGARAGPNNRQGHQDTDLYKWEEMKRDKLITLSICALFFALIVVIIPLTVLIPQGFRLGAWYVLTVCFGGLYGFGFSRTTDAIWRLLPQDVDVANAMGFNVMCRNLGLGVGNFAAGVVLDRFQLPGKLPTTSLQDVNRATNQQMYSVLGYSVMCLLCAICNVGCAFIMRGIRFNHVKHISMTAEAG